MIWDVWFDDGDLTVYEYAYPILKEKGVTATVAIVTDYVGKNYPHYRVQPCPSMDIPQLKELIDAGWEIASHSASHPHFPELPMRKVIHELLESKFWIEDNLGVTPTKFAFPYGEATPELINLAEQYYSYVRPIPPEPHVDAVYHRVSLTPTGPQFDMAGEASPEFLKYMGMNSPATESLPDSKWVFLTGCNNSGTTLLDYLLGEHPEIDLIRGEGHQIRVNGTRTPYPRKFIFPSPAVLGAPGHVQVNRVWTEALDVFRDIKTTPWVAKWSLMNSRKTTGGEYTLVKAPPFMVAMPWFQKHFPEATFIVLVRNGYAVAEGNYRRFNEHWSGMTIRRTARHWRIAHEVMFEDLKELKNYMVIRYEDMCLDLQGMLNLICADLKVEHFDYSTILDKPIPIFKGYRTPRYMRNMNQDSFDRLTEEDLDVIEEEAGDMLKKFGYTRPELILSLG